MGGPVPDEELTKEKVEQWLKAASVGELNIFHDRNKIIVLLCRQLLKCWMALEKEDK